MNRQFHTFEGSLWRGNHIVRENYAKHYRTIDTGAQLRSCLRAGEYAWPGGYQLAFITDDGALLCFDCVKAELQSVIWSIRNECSDGWRVVACGICHDCESETGDHCENCGTQLAAPAADL